MPESFVPRPRGSPALGYEIGIAIDTYIFVCGYVSLLRMSVQITKTLVTSSLYECP